MKRIRFLLLATLACQLTWAYDFAVTNSDGQEIYFNRLTANTVEVTHRGTTAVASYQGEVVIPSSVIYEDKTYEVSSIGRMAFYKCSDLTKVVIPNSVTTIGEMAFYPCSGLSEITIPNSVISLDKDAFRECSNLKTIVIEDGDTELKLFAKSGVWDYHSFRNCKVENLYVGRNIVNWDGLCNSSELKQVTISNSVTSIGKSAFTGCTGLTSIDIPNSVTSIGASAFSSCTGLTEIIIPESVSSIDYSAFFGCTGLTSMVIPNTVTSLGESVFRGCTELKEITLSNSISSLGNYAFQNCTSLISITIPASVTSIGKSAFKGCSALKTVIIEDSDTELSLYTSTQYGDKSFHDCELENLYIGRDLANWDALCLTSFLKDVTLGGFISTIGKYAFQNCTGLASVDIPTTVTFIDAYAFSGCTHLTIDLSNSNASVTHSSFNGIKTLIVGENVAVTSAGGSGINLVVWLPEISPMIKGSVTYEATSLNYLKSSFKVDGFTYVLLSPSDRTCMAIDCDYITEENAEIVLPEKTAYRGIEFTVVTLGKGLMARQDKVSSVTLRVGDETIPAIMFDKCSNLSNIVIPESVTSIEASAFRGCSSLSEVVLPSSVTSIGSSAFYDCTSLTHVTIPASVTYVGGYAFYGCTGLTQVSMGASIASIYGSAFSGCTGLTHVTIPASVNFIGDAAFSGCANLTTLTFEDGVNSLNLDYRFADSSALATLIIGRTIQPVKTASYNPSRYDPYSGTPFSALESLQSVIITDAPKAIADNLFSDCKSLNSVSIGDNVTAIGKQAFSGCSALSVLQLGQNLASIEADAFSSCSNINNIFAEPMTPPSLAPKCLDAIDRWNCTLHVPVDAMDAYKAADQWKEFFFYDSDFAISLSHESINLEGDQTFQLTAYSDSEVRWMTTNPDIAIVDQNGFVIRTGEGECAIIAYNGDNVMANCSVTTKAYTGVENVTEDNSNVSITIKNNVVEIEGLSDIAPVKIFTLDGRLAYSGLNRSLSLNPGIYIIAYPGGSNKICLR